MRPRARRKTLLIVLIVFLVLVVVYSGFQILEPIVFPADRGEDAPTKSRIIVRDGVEYYPRQDVTVLLMMGIDQAGPAQSSGSYNNPGAADMLTVAVFDEVEESYTLLSINRDTMTEVPVLGPGGHPAGTAKQQIALAHTAAALQTVLRTPATRCRLSCTIFRSTTTFRCVPTLSRSLTTRSAV